jgi:hypothetical protein
VATQLQLNISYHIISYHIISYHIISYHIISYITYIIYITSYHTISYIIPYHIIYHIIYHIMYHIIYHITSYIISHHIPYHITSYITPYHIIYHTLSYHIIAYRIISYHIVSYHLILSVVGSASCVGAARGWLCTIYMCVQISARNAITTRRQGVLYCQIVVPGFKYHTYNNFPYACTNYCLPLRWFSRNLQPRTDIIRTHHLPNFTGFWQQRGKFGYKIYFRS